MLSGFASDASYLGGSQSDYLGGIALGPDGALYITGQTGSVDFPTTPGPYSGPLWPFCATQLCSSGFLVKLDLTQSGQAQLAIGAVFPGQSFGGISVAVLPGSLPAVLSSQSQQFTQINPLYGFPVNAAGLLPSLVVLSDNGQSLLLASYLASDGNSNRWFDRMVTNGSGKLYVSGYTNEPGLGTAGAYQPDLAGSYDGLIRSISGIASNRPPMVDLGPPITLSQPLFSLRCGDTVPCNISDADNDPIIGYRLLGPNGLNLFSPVAPPEANLQLTVGSHSFTLLVTDNQGSVGVGSLTVAVVDSVPPVVTAPPDLQDHATEPLGARGSASPALHAFLFTSASATDALDPHPVALPPQADFGAGMVDVDDQTLFPLGSTVVTFRFRDASGTVGTAVATVTVSPNQPPYVSLTPDFTVTATSPAGALVTISAFASDLDNDPLTFVWTGAPASLTANQSPNYAQLSGVLPIGVHTISITVTDGHGGSATASVTITVLGTNTVLGTAPQTVGLFDDNLANQTFSSYTPQNPLGGHLLTLTFSNVLTPGLSYFASRSDLVPPPPANMQAGSPPYYYDIATTAGYSGTIDVCVNIRGMSFANPAAIQLYQLQGGNWTALTSTVTADSQICASVPSLGTFAIFYPEVPETAISTIAGSGFVVGGIDGPGGDPRDDYVASGPATAIALAGPKFGVVERTRNYLYFSDGFHVRRLDLNSGTLMSVFGNGFFVGGMDGPGGDPQDDFVEGAAPLLTPGQPIAIALDAAGNLYYRDANTCQVHKVDYTANAVSTVAGNGTCGYSGDGGPSLQASLGSAYGGLAFDMFGNLFLAEWEYKRIRRVDAFTGIITTIAGTGEAGHPTSGMAATLSAFSQPFGIAFDAQGHLLVSSSDDFLVRIAPGEDSQINGGADEIVSIAVGNAPLLTDHLPFNGDGGTATQAFEQALAVSVAHDGALLLTEPWGMRIRRVSPGADGVVTGALDEIITTIAGYRYTITNGIGIFNGDTYATMAALAIPSSAVEDGQGRIIIIDTNNQRIRRFGLSPILVGPPSPSADLSIDFLIASPDPVNTGANLTYGLTVKNNGPSAATGVILSLPLAASLNFVSTSSSQGACTTPAVGSTGPVSCNLGTLAAGASSSVTIVVTPTATGPLTSVFTLSGNETDPNLSNNTATVQVTVALGPAVINITENIVVTDAPALLPSAMLAVNESITVTDTPAVLPSAMLAVSENIVVTDAPVITAIDNTPPVVTPPPTLVIAATERGGARGNVSQPLHDFLAGGSATDTVDPSVQRLAPQVNGVDVDDTTLFPVGTTIVVFRFVDASGNVGAATALVVVNPPVGGAADPGGGPVTPTDLTGIPLPLEVTFTVVTQPGLVIGTPVTPPPPPPPSYQIGGTVFDITTTALFTPPVDVCFLGAFNAQNRLLHFVDPAWVDVTTQTTATKICGTVTALSPFAVAILLNSPPSASAGSNQTVEATSAAGASVTLNGSGSDPDGDALSFVWIGPCGSAWTASATLTCPLGTSSMTLTVDDGHGNHATANVTVTVRDTTPPYVSGNRSPLPNAAGWNNSDVVVTFSCTDAVGISTAPVTPQTVSAEGVGQSASATCTDTSGNVGMATVGGIKIDKTAPAIVLTRPANGATYALNQNVAASYSCSDTLSGVSSCQGTVANGASIDTSTAGTKQFTVITTDAAGNTSTQSVTYAVTAVAPADLAISKLASPFVKQGYNLTYLITSVNLGPNSASDVGISDVLPPGTSFVRALYRKVSCSLYNGQVACSIPSTGTPCSFDGNTVSCSVGTLAPFSLKNPTGVAVVLVVKATAPAGTIMKNTATVTASNPDPNSKNNVATANTKITK